MIDSNNLRFVSWNVNGLEKATKHGFQNFFRKIDADFFSVQTTKMRESEKKFSFNGYYEFWCDDAVDKLLGTVIYTKHRPLSVLYGLPDGTYRNEGRIITLEYKDFYLVNCYVPYAKNTLQELSFKLEFEDRVRMYYKDLQHHKPVIINGDLNIVHTEKDTFTKQINVNKPGFTEEERIKFGELLELGFIDSFRYVNPFTVKYSKFNFADGGAKSGKGIRSDYFLMPKKLAPQIKNADILTNVKGSNHCPILVDVNYPFSNIYYNY